MAGGGPPGERVAVPGPLRERVLREGNALAAFLRTGARERFGTRSEILVAPA